MLEGGSIAVDGTGVLLTTEQCLLHPNRNPTLGRDEIEQHLKDYLGVDATSSGSARACWRTRTPTATST